MIRSTIFAATGALAMTAKMSFAAMDNPMVDRVILPAKPE